MSRRRVAEKRVVLPDPKFKSELLSRFISVVMVSGKKSIAEKIVYGALDKVVEKTKTQGNDEEVAQIVVFREVLDKIRPTVEVRSRRVGGATYQIPIEVGQKRGVALAMRWLKESARTRNEHGMMERLSREMLDALDAKGNAVKKREDTHRMAKANQAFAHFRWN